jgi:lysophospholipase L1-like esterase
MNWSKITQSIKQTLFNIFVVSLPSLIVFFLLFELVIFRFIMPVSQRANRVFDVEWSIMKLEPNQSGTYRKGLMSEVKGKYRINSDGWNSVRDYSESKGEAIRIAVIGDSYVEAIEVDVDQAFPAILEKDLSEKGYKVEVYRFGLSGASLSEYLQMMRYAYQKFRPDIAMVNIFYNDFTESMAGLSTHNHRLRFKQISTSKFVGVPPEPYAPSQIRRLLGKSTLIRFLYYQMALSERVSMLKHLFKKIEVEQNVDLSALELDESIIGVTRHVFKEFKLLSKQHGVKLLLSIDTPRSYIYSNKNTRKSKVYRFNLISLNAANEIGIEIIDLTDAFVDDYKRNRQRFEFKIDGHWNSRGHRVVGQTISKFLVEQKWLD